MGQAWREVKLQVAPQAQGGNIIFSQSLWYFKEKMMMMVMMMIRWRRRVRMRMSLRFQRDPFGILLALQKSPFCCIGG
jgi:hypothetical protein